jgi:hypothetical protein
MSVNDLDSDRPMSPGLPRPWTWLACVLILMLAGVGFVRGLGGSKPIDAILAPVKGLPAVASLTAADASPLPHNDDWSVLSGPKVLPPPAPKPAKSASSAADSSDAAADQSTPAAQADAQTPDDTASPAPQPTPAPQPAPQQ